ncbi:MAG: 16S rRNA (guanine(527)-N(7))-methyltransferase RsmG [Clostridia bacterium]|nr:16S rRNA (guanine(527)-N(7))-methyltransferase RsmG [Clostridia bacterium]
MTIDREAFIDNFIRAAEKNGLSSALNEEQIVTFHKLSEHLLTVNEQFNLTAIREWERVILLHYIDCLVASSFYPEGATVIDVGCGAGFPTLPLAIARPDLRITGLDSTAKRVSFVAGTAELLGLSNLTTLTGRAEDVAKDARYRERFDVATARAVAALPVLAELCLPFVRTEGDFVALKGKSGKEELASARTALPLLGGDGGRLFDTPLSSLDGESFSHTTVLVKKSKPTPALYPRAYGKILKNPL